MAAESTDRLLRLAEVQTLTALARSTIYRYLKGRSSPVPDFPQPLKIGVRAVRWRESEIIAWMSSRPRATGDRPPV